MPSHGKKPSETNKVGNVRAGLKTAWEATYGGEQGFSDSQKRSVPRILVADRPIVLWR
ncbi:MAG: hypothetical protein L6R35_004262 [Caloplaca aegaea]|nr:MAG: hypothetical protein L6R35_004262 [Caloplaca aegaea]